MEADHHRAVGADVGGHPAQHVGLGLRGHERQDVAGEHRPVEGLGLTPRRQVEVGEVAHQPARAGVIGLGRGHQHRVDVDPDHLVAQGVQLRTDAAGPAPGVEQPGAGRYQRVHQAGLAHQVGPVGGHGAEPLDVPLGVPVAGVGLPTRETTERLGEGGEAQVRTAGHTEALVSVRERGGLPGGGVAPPVVPGDEVVTDVDHAQHQLLHAPAVPGDALGLVEHRPPHPAPLAGGVHREHAQVGLAPFRATLELATGHQLGAAPGQHHLGVGLVQQGRQHRGVDALAVEQVGLGGPARPAGLAPVRRLDQGHHGVDVVGGGEREDELARVGVRRVGVHRRGHGHAPVATSSRALARATDPNQVALGLGVRVKVVRSTSTSPKRGP